MQGIYSYTLETNHVSRVCSVAAVLYLQSVLHVTVCSVAAVLYLYSVLHVTVFPVLQLYCAYSLCYM